MYRSDSLILFLAASTVCLISCIDCTSRTYHHTVRQTTLPRIGREPLDEAPELDLEDVVDKRAMRLMRIGRRRWDEDVDAQQVAEEKRAMRLMRLGKRGWEDAADEVADAGSKRAMRLMRLGKKSVGGLYRPNIRYGK